MNFTKIKLPKVPTNIHNLRDYKDFVELIKFAQDVNKNVDKYAKQIVYGEYLKSKSEWKKILSEKDFEKIKDFQYRYHASGMINNDPMIFYSIGDNRFHKVKPLNIAPTTGYGGDHFEFTFDVKNQKIIAEFISSWDTSRLHNTRSERQPIVDIQTFTIDLISKIITYDSGIELTGVDFLNDDSDEELIEKLEYLVENYKDYDLQILEAYEKIFKEIKLREIKIEDWMIINKKV